MKIHRSLMNKIDKILTEKNNSSLSNINQKNQLYFAGRTIVNWHVEYCNLELKLPLKNAIDCPFEFAIIHHQMNLQKFVKLVSGICIPNKFRSTIGQNVSRIIFISGIDKKKNILVEECINADCQSQ